MTKSPIDIFLNIEYWGEDLTRTFKLNKGGEEVMFTILESRRMVLQPVSAEDNKILFKWRNQLDFLKLVSSKRTIVSFDEFLQEQKRTLGKSRHSQFVIWAKSEPRIAVGTIYVFNLNLTDGHAFVNLYIDQKWRNIGYGPESGMLLSCYYFDFFPIFKIYLDAFGYNLPSISVMETAGLVKEGVLRGHRFFNGQRHDVVRFALYRDKLEHVRRLVVRFKKMKGGT